jgi:hypothetical protein
LETVTPTLVVGQFVDSDACQAGQPVGARVGAEYRVTSRDLQVFVEVAAEPVMSGDLDVGVDGVGKRL